MHVSFVVPLFNCLPLTQAMVESLQATIPAALDFEIILVDDGSTDGTREWLATLSAPFRVLLNEGNKGYAVACNRGGAAASGIILVFLNNDLVLTHHWLEPMLSVHRRLGSRAGLVGNVQFDARSGLLNHSGIAINHKGKPEHLRRRFWNLTRFLIPLRRTTALTGACFLASRALWNELGGFDEGYFNGCEDVDLCLRASAAGCVNAVALGSRVLHHISTAPGRKDRDEANTHRLTMIWRETLVEKALPDWCRHHFETFLPEPRDFPDPALARQIFLYLHGLRRPPQAAVPGVRAAIDVEIARWEKMFGGPAPPVFRDLPRS
jgi:GT2 family glycosyltransferase